MDSQNLQQTQPTVIDAQTLQQLQEEIQEEMREILKNSNFVQILEKYGISGDNITIQGSIDLSKTESGAIFPEIQENSFLSVPVDSSFQFAMSFSGSGGTSFSGTDRNLQGTISTPPGDIRCNYSGCGFLNKISYFDPKHPPMCQNPKPPEHELQLS